MTKVVEFRGVDNLVAAEVLTDDNELESGYTVGEVFSVAPVAEISKTTETSSETKYYDNLPALVINSEGPDEIGVTCAIPDLATYAKLVGKSIDSETGAMIDGERDPKYYALGYRFKKTDGTYRYVWRLKGMFAIPDEASQTETNGTDSNNMELTLHRAFQQQRINLQKAESQQKRLLLMIRQHQNAMFLHSLIL